MARVMVVAGSQAWKLGLTRAYVSRVFRDSAHSTGGMSFPPGEQPAND